jgi:hypothetical protein
MPKDAREPQSYGSQADWLTGKTGQKVETPTPRESTIPDDDVRGGHAQQAADDTEADVGAVDDASMPVQKVTAREGGAKRDSYFRKRDYE